MNEDKLNSEDIKEEKANKNMSTNINGNNGKYRKTVITPNLRFYDLILKHYLKNRKPKTIKSPYK